MQKGTVYNFYKDLPPWAKGVSILVILGIGVVTYFSIKKWLKNRPPKVTYPQGGKGIPLGFDPKPYAEKAYNAMKGVNFSISPQRDSALISIASLPTDDMFVSVYDVFNQMYMGEGEGTLREWIEDEWFISMPIKNTLKARFDKLNLK